MTSEEDEEESKAGFEGEEETGREASSAVDHQGCGDAPSPVHHVVISSRLEDEWPEIELGGEKGLVVCSIDVQLLTGGWAAECHKRCLFGSYMYTHQRTQRDIHVSPVDICGLCTPGLTYGDDHMMWRVYCSVLC
ncbi:unnamed protein product [Ectocarpus sp. 12 AP-2014]